MHLIEVRRLKGCKRHVLARVQLTACKVGPIEEFAKKMLAEGHCVVIGLQSTGEIF